MNVVPALVAGVRRIVVVTAPFKGKIDKHILAVARLLGVEEVYGISGAQGIAALAYGTKTIPKVDKIVGPGNKWVTAAKRFVFGTVGIDSLAGPSEVVVIAPETSDPELVAIDLMAQAEHGTGDEASVAFVPTQAFAEQVRDAVKKLAEQHDLTGTVQNALTRYGTIFVTADIKQAVKATNRLAPEHVEWLYPEDHPSLDNLRHFGALFVGPHTPEAIGDYYAGSNHVLPTQGTARFSSGLTVYDFIRSSSVVKYSDTALLRASDAVQSLAGAENMRAHGLSVSLRAKKLSGK
jgi:histidinol dehydrogenase